MVTSDGSEDEPPTDRPVGEGEAENSDVDDARLDDEFAAIDAVLARADAAIEQKAARSCHKRSGPVQGPAGLRSRLERGRAAGGMARRVTMRPKARLFRPNEMEPTDCEEKRDPRERSGHRLEDKRD